MDKQSLIRLFNHHYRANHQLWNSIAALNDKQFTQTPSDGSPSIRTQIVGMVANENLWVNYLWHGEVEFLQDCQFPTRTCIRGEWDALEEEMLDFIEELSAAALESQVEPAFLTKSASLKLWEILVQVIHKAAQSRAQLYLHLRRQGVAVPSEDSIQFFEQQYSIPA